VIGEDTDDVLGVVHVKSAIAVPREHRDQVPVTDLMSDVLRVPETVRLDPLLVTLRQQGLQLAVVVDEYGGTAGVATLEDVVEEIVGELSDEHDRSRPGIVRRRDGSYSLPGLLRPDEVRTRLDLPIPDGRAYETIGGYLMSALGRVPRPGDEVRLPGAVLRVERMDGRRVDRMRAVPTPMEPADGANAPASGRANAPASGRANAPRTSSMAASALEPSPAPSQPGAPQRVAGGAA
jgi:CBS domain containing-hemolysin-like protein